MQLLTTVLSLALLARSVLAQGAQINYPTPGSTLTAGSDITVEFQVDDFIENEDVIAVVIGLSSCTGTCPPFDSNSSVGNVLYQGPYTSQPPFYRYDNYTVTIPQGFTPGNATLNSITFYLVGDGLEPVLYFSGENVTVVA